MLTCQNLTFHIIAHALGLVNILRKKSASNAHLPQTHKKTAAHAACLSRLPWSRMWVFTKFRFKERMTLFSIPCYHNRCHLSSIFCGFPASRLHFLLFPPAVYPVRQRKMPEALSHSRHFSPTGSPAAPRSMYMPAAGCDLRPSVSALLFLPRFLYSSSKR